VAGERSLFQVKYADLINRFYEVAERKISLRDSYGEERWDALNTEVNVVIRKIAQKDGRSDKNRYNQLSEFLKGSFKERHANKRGIAIEPPGGLIQSAPQRVHIRILDSPALPRALAQRRSPL
jgi:hypothetical protein